MRVMARDHTLQRRGLLTVLSGSAVVRLNDVSTFILTIDASTNTWKRFMPGWGVIIDDDHGQRVLSGLVTEIVSTLDKTGARTMKITGVSDEHLLQDMITLPTPSRAIDRQDVDGYYKATGPARDVMANLIEQLIGARARTEYKISDLTVDRTGPTGQQVTLNTRFKPLIEELQALAIAGGLNYRIVQEDRRRTLTFFEGRDYSRAVRLTMRSGAVSSYELTQAAPTVTEVAVAGQGQGAARTIKRMTGNTSDWNRRIVRFQDRRDTDNAEDLTQAGQDTLSEGQERAALAFEVNDVPGRRFLTDFTVGDRVTVQLDTGVVVTDVVQSGELSWDENGQSVGLQVGPVQDERNAPAWVKPVRAQARAIRGLQTI